MPKPHRVAAGECLSSIAFRHGLKPQTIWDLPENRELRAQRPNMFQLVPGDVVFIPDRRLRSESVETDRAHRFRMIGVPEKLRIQLKDAAARPRSKLAYRLTVDGAEQHGTLDGEGRIDVFIPPEAAIAVLAIDGPDGPEEYEFALGHDVPKKHTPGLLRGLRRAGVLGEQDDNRTVIEALRAYQAARGIPVTGDADRATWLALQDDEGRRR